MNDLLGRKITPDYGSKLVEATKRRLMTNNQLLADLLDYADGYAGRRLADKDFHEVYEVNAWLETPRGQELARRLGERHDLDFVAPPERFGTNVDDRVVLALIVVCVLGGLLFLAYSGSLWPYKAT